MATRPLAELTALNPNDLVTREEIGIMAGLTRAEGDKHLTVNQWLHRYGPGGTAPQFPDTYTSAGDPAAKHRVGEIRRWLVETGRIRDSSAADQYIGRTEICDLLDIRPPTLKAWVWRQLFPIPDARQGRYARWRRETVEDWITALADEVERIEAGIGYIAV